jgi:hypothetical protein
MRHRALALGDIAPLATGFHEGSHFVVIPEFAFLDRGLDANDLACLDAIAAKSSNVKALRSIRTAMEFLFADEVGSRTPGHPGHT